MTIKEKYINLIGAMEDVVANLPVQIGSTLYEIHSNTDVITERVVDDILFKNSVAVPFVLICDNYSIESKKLGKYVFTAKEDAEEIIAMRKNNKGISENNKKETK